MYEDGGKLQPQSPRDELVPQGFLRGFALTTPSLCRIVFSLVLLAGCMDKLMSIGPAASGHAIQQECTNMQICARI